MSLAMAAVKQQYGEDALIVDKEERLGEVTLYVRTASAQEYEKAIDPKKEATLPVWARRADTAPAKQTENQTVRLDVPTTITRLNSKPFPQSRPQPSVTRGEDALSYNSDEATPINCFQDPLTAITTVCDLVNYHQLGEHLAEQWLLELNQDLTKTPIRIDQALERVIAYDPLWLRSLDEIKTIVFVGGPGSGKTVCFAKIAAMLIARGKKIKAVTLDIVKSTGAAQLEAYLAALGVPLQIGHKSIAKRKSDEILLIDTPALNVLNPKDYAYLEALHEKTQLPLTLVVPADKNPFELDEMMNAYAKVGASSVIVTRLDLTQRYGTLLRAATFGFPLVMLSKSPDLGEGMMTPHIETIVNEMLQVQECNAYGK